MLPEDEGGPEGWEFFDSPEWTEFAAHVQDELMPRLRDSAATISLLTGRLDAKFAVELGVSIMLDKPIIAVVLPGVELPAKLRGVCDAVVEGSLESDATREQLFRALDRVAADLERRAKR